MCSPVLFILLMFVDSAGGCKVQCKLQLWKEEGRRRLRPDTWDQMSPDSHEKGLPCPRRSSLVENSLLLFLNLQMLKKWSHDHMTHDHMTTWSHDYSRDDQVFNTLKHNYLHFNFLKEVYSMFIFVKHSILSSKTFDLQFIYFAICTLYTLSHKSHIIFLSSWFAHVLQLLKWNIFVFYWKVEQFIWVTDSNFLYFKFSSDCFLSCTNGQLFMLLIKKLLFIDLQPCCLCFTKDKRVFSLDNSLLN